MVSLLSLLLGSQVLKAHVRKLEQRVSGSQQLADGELMRRLEELERERDQARAECQELEAGKKVSETN